MRKKSGKRVRQTAPRTPQSGQAPDEAGDPLPGLFHDHPVPDQRAEQTERHGAHEEQAG